MLVEFIELLKAYLHLSAICRALQIDCRVLGEETEPFNGESSVKQGCILSPVVFNCCIDLILERELLSFDCVVMRLGINVSGKDYADEIDTHAAEAATA